MDRGIDMTAAEQFEPNIRTINAVVAHPGARRSLEDWARAHGGKVNFHPDRSVAAGPDSAWVIEAGDDSEAKRFRVKTTFIHRRLQPIRLRELNSYYVSQYRRCSETHQV